VNLTAHRARHTPPLVSTAAALIVQRRVAGRQTHALWWSQPT